MLEDGKKMIARTERNRTFYVRSWHISAGKTPQSARASSTAYFGGIRLFASKLPVGVRPLVRCRSRRWTSPELGCVVGNANIFYEGPNPKTPRAWGEVPVLIAGKPDSYPLCLAVLGRFGVGWRRDGCGGR